MSPRLKIKTPEQCHTQCSGAFIGDFKHFTHISHTDASILNSQPVNVGWLYNGCTAVQCKVRSGGVIYGKEGFILYVLYGLKLDKISKWKSVSYKGGQGEGGILADKFC